MGLGVDFGLPLSQQQQEQDEEPPPKLEFDTKDQVLFFCLCCCCASLSATCFLRRLSKGVVSDQNVTKSEFYPIGNQNFQNDKNKKISK